MNNNNNNLNDLISSSKIKNLLNIISSEDCIMIFNKSESQEIMYANDNSLELFENRRLVGKSILSTNHSIGRFFKDNKKQLAKYREDKISSEWLVISKHPKSSQYKLMKITDYPIYEGKYLAGSYVKLVEQNLSSTKNIIKLFSEISNQDSKNTSTITKLSPLENEILFLLVLGKSPKEIAQLEESIIGREINCSTISSIINKRIYNKLNAVSVSTAIENALITDTLHEIPENFLNNLKINGILLDTKECIFEL